MNDPETIGAASRFIRLLLRAGELSSLQSSDESSEASRRLRGLTAVRLAWVEGVDCADSGRDLVAFFVDLDAVGAGVRAGDCAGGCGAFTALNPELIVVKPDEIGGRCGAGVTAGSVLGVISGGGDGDETRLCLPSDAGSVLLVGRVGLLPGLGVFP